MTKSDEKEVLIFLGTFGFYVLLFLIVVIVTTYQDSKEQKIQDIKYVEVFDQIISNRNFTEDFISIVKSDTLLLEDDILIKNNINHEDFNYLNEEYKSKIINFLKEEL